MKRTGLTAVLVAALASPLAAQNATPADLTAEYLSDMATVEEKLVALAEAIPEEQYGWRPMEGVRSVSEAFMHVTSENYFYMPATLGAGPPADLNMGTGREIPGNLEKVTSKADVIRHLHASYAYQKKVLADSEAKLATGKLMVFGQERTVAGLFNLFLADQHEHLGQLIAYARSLKVVPPWSAGNGGG